MKMTTLSNGQPPNRFTRISQPEFTEQLVRGSHTRRRSFGAYRTMLLSRRIDDKEIQLKNQSLIYLPDQRRGPRSDPRRRRAWRFAPATTGSIPYYRDRALCLTLGMTPREMFLAAVGSRDDVTSGGRQMPSHWGDAARHIVSQSSATGTQCLHAIGCAEAACLYERVTDIPDRETLFRARRSHLRLGRRRRDERRRVLGVADGRQPAEAARPLPRRRQRLRDLSARRRADARRQHLAAGRGFSRPARRPRCDGTDFLESYRALKDAVAWCRERRGPALVHAA